MYIKGKLIPMPNDILVCNLEKGMQKTKNGIILPEDNGKEFGIRPRWCQIFRIGKNIDNPDLKVGNWLLMDHGHWSTTIEIEENENKPIFINIIIDKNIKEGVLLVSEEVPEDIQTIDRDDISKVKLF